MESGGGRVMTPEELKKIRKVKLKKTQLEMATSIGIGLSTFHRYEKGYQEIPAWFGMLVRVRFA